MEGAKPTSHIGTQTEADEGSEAGSPPYLPAPSHALPCSIWYFPGTEAPSGSWVLSDGQNPISFLGASTRLPGEVRTLIIHCDTPALQGYTPGDHVTLSVPLLLFPRPLLRSEGLGQRNIISQGVWHGLTMSKRRDPSRTIG